MTYLEKLKDPRWQKKRLQILERDHWECIWCSDNTTSLHVHHLRYTGNPWDAPNEDLITICENCHNEIHSNEYKKAITELTISLQRKGFSTTDILGLAYGFTQMQSFHIPSVMVDVINSILTDAKSLQKFMQNYFKKLQKKNKCRTEL